MQVRDKLLLLLVLIQFGLSAQNFTDKQIQQRDSLTAKLKADSSRIFRFQKLRPYFNIDQRYSYIKDAPININGIQLGVLLHERHAIGLGAYTISATSKQSVKTKTDKTIDLARTLDLKYTTVFYQYTAIDKRYFELDLQAEFGLGHFDLKVYDSKTWTLIPKLSRSAGMLVSGIGTAIAIKPFRWVGIMGMAGYRLTSVNTPNLNFNGVYYGYGLWLDIRQIIRDIRYYAVKKPKYKKQVSHLLK
jgi:hypothetical protein